MLTERTGTKTNYICERKSISTLTKDRSKYIHAFSKIWHLSECAITASSTVYTVGNHYTYEFPIT